jgi:hypothetical protein
MTSTTILERERDRPYWNFPFTNHQGTFGIPSPIPKTGGEGERGCRLMKKIQGFFLSIHFYCSFHQVTSPNPPRRNPFS